MLKLLIFVALPFILGYAMGRTRSRDRMPREWYDARGRRVS